MEISSPLPDRAEQDPAQWWNHVVKAIRMAMFLSRSRPDGIRAIGITYQMHGLVCLDRHGNILRPAIIWCDSRAVETGQVAFEEIGKERCLDHLLNAPGNFTASRLAWVKENEPEIFFQIDTMLLPGDYIHYRLTGERSTTVQGLSEAILWDFSESGLASLVLDYFGIPSTLIPEAFPAFGIQGRLHTGAARELGLVSGIPVTFRAGDQPTNAFSLNVTRPNEVAATAGTSGVLYGVAKSPLTDPASRINTFLHVNHKQNDPRVGLLLCINGTGILNSWLKRITQETDYDRMNAMAALVPPGAEGITMIPFGNGAERMLGNRIIGSHMMGLNLNVHRREHLYRAAQEGVAFAMFLGFRILKETGLSPSVLRAGESNMFLSPIFAKTMATLTMVPVELFRTDCSLGAARGAALGAGLYASEMECFRNLLKVSTIHPDLTLKNEMEEAFLRWEEKLHEVID